MNVDKEFASLIPPLSAEELAGLEASLLAEGCRDALVLWNGTLLDGHNRKRLCDKHGILYGLKSIQLPDRDAAKRWILANQLHRRNLTPDQRRLLMGEFYHLEKKTQAEAGAIGGKSGAQNAHRLEKTAERIAKQYSVDPATVRRAEKTYLFVEQLKKEDPEQAKAIRDGKVKIVEARRQAKRADVAKAAALPSRKFRVLYADPPWKYGDHLTESYGATKYHYPSMSITELCALPIGELACDDAVLFLWVTSPLLEECFAVIKAWGFQYKASFVWDKVKHNMGHYNSVRHEFLLICTRGSCLPDAKELIDSVQSVERSTHSAKPEQFRRIIERLYPHGKRIELFAREDHDGWKTWGNQV